MNLAGLARALLRLAIYPGVIAASFGEYALRFRGSSTRARADWLQRVAQRHARWFGLRVRVHGEVPRTGLVVANHISYLDIVGLSAAGAFAFVAKKEVATWPLFGAYARFGDTIFVDREQRGAVADVSDQMRAHLAASVPIVLFPEGTSTGGDTVLPFRSSLFDPVVKLACPVTACGLRYELEGGSVPDEVAYWRDMTLVPHLFNLLKRKTLTLHLHFAPPHTTPTDRKALARQMHAEVSALASAQRATSPKI
jgi:lyso-ornithine lipid O-acyltransferase